MKLLLVAATEQEISPFIKYIHEKWEEDEKGYFHFGELILSVHIHGVGMLSTSYNLTKLLQHEKYDFLLQVGVGGSFNRQIKLGEIVMITEETLGDLGAEHHFQFLDLFELNLAHDDSFPFSKGKLIMPETSFFENNTLKRVKGLTVNSVSGSLFTVSVRQEKFHCDVESMEGAAFHFVCLSEKIPFIQLRSISNYVEPRDKSKWKMKEAIESLNKELIALFDNFTV